MEWIRHLQDTDGEIDLQCLVDKVDEIKKVKGKKEEGKMKCKKCKSKMKFIKYEWVDDNKGNSGDVKVYSCVCGHEQYKVAD